MRHISIIFHPEIQPNLQKKADEYLGAIISRPGTPDCPPICSFEGACMENVYSGGMYDITPVWEKSGCGRWNFEGFRVVASPSLYLMGHDLLPSNDMHTARQLAFTMLAEMWWQHYEDNPFFFYFSEYKATVTTATASFYAVFPSAEAAKNAVQRGAFKLLSQYETNHDGQLVSDELGGCHIEFDEEMILTLVLAKSHRTLPKWLKLNTSLTAETHKNLFQFAERVVQCELEFTPQWFDQNTLRNPLIWDFPEVNAFKIFESELQDVLSDDFPIEFQLAPRFPKSIMKQTFNRDTANAYLEKVWETCDGNGGDH